MISILITIALYFVVLVLIGIYFRKKTFQTADDYFMAGRSFGFVLLVVSLYATQQTAFGIIGVPAIGYSQGIGVLGYISAPMALIPLMFYLLGHRSWILGKVYGYMTQAEVVSERFNSNWAGYIMFILLAIYSIPYIMISVIGGGVAIEAMTQGAISYTVGCLIVTAVIYFYVVTGGMRTTVYTNFFQGALFLTFFIFASIFIVKEMGGIVSMFNAIERINPSLLIRSGSVVFTKKAWFSFFIIMVLSPAMFPQIFMRLLTARTVDTLKRHVVVYPWIVLAGWLPVILIGLAGIIAIPGLEGTATDNVVPLMLQKFLHPVFIGLGLASIAAAVMSSLDAQIFAISTMLTRDVVSKVWKVSEKTQVLWGKVFVSVIALIGFVGALIRPATILAISEYAFTGYAVLFPVLFASLYWRRANKFGVIASMLVTFIALQLFFTGMLPPSAAFGFLPIIPLVVISVVVLVAVSLLTPEESKEQTGKFFNVFGRILKGKTEKEFPSQVSFK